MITKVILFPLTFVRFLMEKRGKLQQCSFALYTEHDLVVEKGYEPLAASLRCLWLYVAPQGDISPRARYVRRRRVYGLTGAGLILRFFFSVGMVWCA
jgi:hypothetical protein